MVRKSAVFWLAIAGSVWMAACGGGDSSPKPEGTCTLSKDQCADETPSCSGHGMCTHACTKSEDCSDLEVQTSCDRNEGLCAAPCATDEVGSYACVKGERIFCADSPKVSCAICPGVCGNDAYCAGTTCAPLKARGDACASPDECKSGVCNDSGHCSADQGEECTAETCSGVCAQLASGATACILAACPYDCSSSKAGGYDWTCINLGNRDACLPVENCVWQGACSNLADGTCGQACGDSSGCVTYCVPNEISTDR